MTTPVLFPCPACPLQFHERWELDLHRQQHPPSELTSVDPDLVSRVAQWFHEEYERLAPGYGYATRQDSAVPWPEVPVLNRLLMLDTVARVLNRMVEAGIELPMEAP